MSNTSRQSYEARRLVGNEVLGPAFWPSAGLFTSRSSSRLRCTSKWIGSVNSL